METKAKRDLEEKLKSNKRFGSRAGKGVGERKGVRDPFAKAVVEGIVNGWQDLRVFKSVQVGIKQGGGWTQEADLVLVRRTGEIGVAECKLDRTSQSRHGMLEQALLYCELIRRLNPGEFGNRLRAAKEISVSGVKDEHQVPKAALKNLNSVNPLIVPIVVVDRWGGTANRTAGLALDLLNNLLARAKLPNIQVFAINSDGSPVVVDLVIS